jgi:hypothetical protein
MKLTKCKRCNAENVFWSQSMNGRWTLTDNATLQQHFCEDGKLKAVKCKYCSADDLHWAEEINPVTQLKKVVLTESYGLPHACDERIAAIAKEKQDKKDKYEAEKKRVANHPDGKCPTCGGTGYSSPNFFTSCPNCYGQATFTERTRKTMLAVVRAKIWPDMQPYNYNKRRWW